MKLEVKFQKSKKLKLWGYSNPPIEEGLYSSRTKAINAFLRTFYKLIKGKTEFTLIGICGEKEEVDK